MQLFLILGIPAALFYGYWFFVRKAQPVVTAPNTSVRFESVVPVVEEQEIELLFEKPEEETGQVAFLENDESVLLMEAERVISEIETIASSQENVPAKIKALLSGFNLFYNTDYQEAINHFIGATLKRECELDLTAEELSALWQ